MKDKIYEKRESNVLDSGDEGQNPQKSGDKVLHYLLLNKSSKKEMFTAQK